MQALVRKQFVLFTDNPRIGLTGEPQVQLVTLEMIEKRPGYISVDREEISKLELDKVWHDRNHPDEIKIWRVM